MSWSCYTKGTKEETKANVEASLDGSVKLYSEYGTPQGDQEAQDCRDAKRAILSAIEDIDSLEPDSYAPKGYDVDVTAYGSRSMGSLALHAEVTKRPKP